MENAFKNLGVQNFEEFFNKAVQSDLFQKLETGKISDQEFRDELRNFTGINIDDDILDHTWNQIIGDYPPNRIELLKTIKPNYRLFLLSNTNQYSLSTSIFKNLKMNLDLISFLCLKKLTGRLKSDVVNQMMNHICMLLNENNLVPEETLFIDDSIQNIKTAKNIGIKAVYLEHGMEVTDLFENGWLLENEIK